MQNILHVVKIVITKYEGKTPSTAVYFHLFIFLYIRTENTIIISLENLSALIVFVAQKIRLSKDKNRRRNLFPCLLEGPHILRQASVA